MTSEGSEWYQIDQGNHLVSFRISLESFRLIRGPLFHKPVTGQVLFLNTRYTKLALAASKAAMILN